MNINWRKFTSIVIKTNMGLMMTTIMILMGTCMNPMYIIMQLVVLMNTQNTTMDMKINTIMDTVMFTTMDTVMNTTMDTVMIINMIMSPVQRLKHSLVFGISLRKVNSSKRMK